MVATAADPGGFIDAGSAYVYGLVTTDVVSDETGKRPVQFELSQNHPNPFNPSTTIRYFLPEPQDVTVEIFDLFGERVRIWAQEAQAVREHSMVWDGTDSHGKSLPSGTFFYRLKGQDLSETKKMMLLK